MSLKDLFKKTPPPAPEPKPAPTKREPEPNPVSIKKYVNHNMPMSEQNRHALVMFAVHALKTAPNNYLYDNEKSVIDYALAFTFGDDYLLYQESEQHKQDEIEQKQSKRQLEINELGKERTNQLKGKVTKLRGYPNKPAFGCRYTRYEVQNDELRTTEELVTFDQLANTAFFEDLVQNQYLPTKKACLEAKEKNTDEQKLEETNEKLKQTKS